MKYEVGKQKLAWFSPKQLEQFDFLKETFPEKSQGLIIREAIDLYYRTVKKQQEGK